MCDLGLAILAGEMNSFRGGEEDFYVCFVGLVTPVFGHHFDGRHDAQELGIWDKYIMSGMMDKHQRSWSARNVVASQPTVSMHSYCIIYPHSHAKECQPRAREAHDVRRLDGTASTWTVLTHRQMLPIALLLVVLFAQPSWSHDVHGFMEEKPKIMPAAPLPPGYGRRSLRPHILKNLN